MVHCRDFVCGGTSRGDYCPCRRIVGVIVEAGLGIDELLEGFQRKVSLKFNLHSKREREETHTL